MGKYQSGQMGPVSYTHLRRIPMCSAFYIPFLFVLNNSIVLHRSIWHFIPETWVEYYYEPSLNPLSATQPVSYTHLQKKESAKPDKNKRSYF